jgi:protein O-mannosyl-transferase
MPGKPRPVKKNLVKPAPEKTFGGKNVLWASGIVLITFIVFSPALTADFINFDDIQYVTDNPFIRTLSDQNLKTILLTDVNQTGNWHPLTMLSLALDYSISGSNPLGFHLTNILIHLLNTTLVFYLLFMLCLRLKQNNKVLVSTIAALLFGIHPMHVESVAWISGRKDLLFTFFYLLSMLCYLQYLTGSKRKYLVVSVVFFILSLLSKAMAVTLPVMLLLIDYMTGRKIRDKKVWMEKIPYLLLSLLFGIITILTQKSGGATEIIKNSFPEQLAFASYGFFMYFVKIMYPFHLSGYYPYPEKINGAISFSFYFYFIPVIFICGLLLYLFRTKKSERAFFGLLFFIINLLLVLQIIPVGSAVMADRYSYLSSIGIFFIIGSGIAALAERGPRQKILVIAVFLIYATVLSVKAYERCSVWKNSTAFWEDVTDKFPRFAPALNNLGIIKEKEGNNTEALSFYTKAMDADPAFANAAFNRGTLYGKTGQLSNAIRDLNKAIQLTPGLAKAYTNRAIAKAQTNDLPGALDDLNQSIALEKTEDAFYNRGFLEIQMKRYPQAVDDFNEVIRLNPGSVKSYFSRGLAHLNGKNFRAANADFSTCISKTPDDGNAYYYRAVAMIESGDAKNCCEDLQKAVQLGNKASEALLRKYCQK